MSNPEKKRWSASLALKLVASILLGYGIVAAALALWIVERQLAHVRADTMIVAAMVVFIVAVAVFCFLVGYRLLLNRPNSLGSALSPAAWRILGELFGAIALVTTAIVVVGGPYRHLLGFACAACLAMLSHGCFILARSPVLRLASSIPSILFTPDTSLLARGGFAPPGFRCGIEILNDNRTPMVFVVLQLRDTMHMPQAEAIKVMLDIHQKGGVLLPTSTPEEADRIADSIAAAARSNKHPLVCRAVVV